MRNPDRSNPWNRGARLALLGVGALLLAGCATGYSFVQPDMAGSGAYYTSDGPYTGQGYYDYYGTGPYYPGTSGWGYYGGTWPYSDPYGWYGGYGYGSSLTFGFGFSNVWGFPGYWGPWYSSNWGCGGWYGCGGWRHHHHNRHDPDPSAPKPWLKPDHPPVPPRIVRNTGSAPPIAQPTRPVPRRPVEGFANRRPLGSTGFAPHDFVRAPVRRTVETGFERTPNGTFNRTPTRSGWVPPRPDESGFASRREMRIPQATPRESRPVSQPVFRVRTPPPVRAVASPPVRSAPPPHRDRRVDTEIQ